MLIGGGLIFFRMQSSYSELNQFFAAMEKKYFRIEEISQLLNEEYYDQAELLSGEAMMIEQATKAFVDGLGDPFTSYLDAEQFSGLQSDLEGEGKIEGIGAVVGKKDYYVQIEEVVKDSPAFKAGLLPLDRIVLI